MSKQRLDLLLVERGLAESRSLAAALIMAGKVYNDSKCLDKPGHLIDPSAYLSVKQTAKYASRAGDKLASVAKFLELTFEGKTVLDVGSSTGGFTDYALQNGATKVYAIDVGTAQLAYKLQLDKRVISLEKTDIRDVSSLPDKIDIALIDVSFISLAKVLPATAKLTEGPIIAMMKPQFEAGKEIADRFKGVISNEAVRQEIINTFEQSIARDFTILAAADSGVSGVHGNIERFYKIASRH